MEMIQREQIGKSNISRVYLISNWHVKFKFFTIVNHLASMKQTYYVTDAVRHRQSTSPRT